MFPLILIPILAAGGAYAAYKKGLFGHKPGGPAAPVSAVNASAAIQKQISQLQGSLVAEQNVLAAMKATNNPTGIAVHTANIQGLQTQISQLQSQLSHAGTL